MAAAGGKWHLSPHKVPSGDSLQVRNLIY